MLTARSSASSSSSATLLRRINLLGAARSKSTLLAALVERPPVVTPEPTVLESKQRYFDRKYEGSHKVYPSSLTSAEEGPDQQRARQRMEAIIENEASREGEGDRTGDERSLDRRLAQRLYLLVRQSPDGPWHFPQRAWAGPSERARDGLQAAIADACGESLGVHQMGNAPLGHMEVADDTLFLWRFQHVSGDVDAEESGVDYAWLTKEELAERLDPRVGSEFARMVCGPFE